MIRATRQNAINQIGEYYATAAAEPVVMTREQLDELSELELLKATLDDLEEKMPRKQAKRLAELHRMRFVANRKAVQL